MVGSLEGGDASEIGEIEFKNETAYRLTCTHCSTGNMHVLVSQKEVLAGIEKSKSLLSTLKGDD